MDVRIVVPGLIRVHILMSKASRRRLRAHFCYGFPGNLTLSDLNDISSIIWILVVCPACGKTKMAIRVKNGCDILGGSLGTGSVALL